MNIVKATHYALSHVRLPAKILACLSCQPYAVSHSVSPPVTQCTLAIYVLAHPMLSQQQPLAAAALTAFSSATAPQPLRFTSRQEYLVEEEGLSPDQIFPISAVTGSGVTELVRGVRALLEQMGPAEVAMETNALNVTEVPKGRDAEARVDVFSVEAEEQGGMKYYVVEGDAVERFAQMTNWDYYEAVKR